MCNKFVLVLKKRPVKPKPKWFSNDLERLSKEKNRLWFKCKYSNFRNKKLVTKYNKVEKSLSNKIKTEVRSFERNLASQAKKNPKLIFSHMKKKRKFKDGINALMINEKISTDRKEIADKINGYFKSVFTSESDSSITTQTY